MENQHSWHSCCVFWKESAKRQPPFRQDFERFAQKITNFRPAKNDCELPVPRKRPQTSAFLFAIVPIDAPRSFSPVHTTHQATGLFDSLIGLLERENRDGRLTPILPAPGATSSLDALGAAHFSEFSEMHRNKSRVSKNFWLTTHGQLFTMPGGGRGLCPKPQPPQAKRANLRTDSPCKESG